MEYNPADDQWVSPFADEVASGGEATDGRRAPPSPHVAFDKRVLRQTFEYDWLGNTDKSGDDARGFYDRSAPLRMLPPARPELRKRRLTSSAPPRTSKAR